MNPGQPSRRSIAWPLAAIVLAAVAVIGAVVVARTPQPTDPATAALRATTEGAIRSLRGGHPPATYEGGPLPSSTIAAIRTRVSADIDRYFTDRLQARYRPMILDAVDQIGRSEWDAEGDLRFDWAEAIVTGDRAIVQVTEVGWVVRRGGQFGTSPTASHRLDWTQDWTVSLVRVAGEWRVDEVDFTCPGGCG
jgi:hypothetical protein